MRTNNLLFWISQVPPFNTLFPHELSRFTRWFFPAVRVIEGKKSLFNLRECQRLISYKIGGPGLALPRRAPGPATLAPLEISLSTVITQPDPAAVLRTHFGLEEFRPGQEEVIRAVLVVRSTGTGRGRIETMDSERPYSLNEWA